jgi:hypothetical protein
LLSTTKTFETEVERLRGEKILNITDELKNNIKKEYEVEFKYSQFQYMNIYKQYKNVDTMKLYHPKAINFTQVENLEDIGSLGDK